MDLQHRRTRNRPTSPTSTTDPPPHVPPAPPTPFHLLVMDWVLPLLGTCLGSYLLEHGKDMTPWLWAGYWTWLVVLVGWGAGRGWTEMGAELKLEREREKYRHEEGEDSL